MKRLICILFGLVVCIVLVGFVEGDSQRLRFAKTPIMSSPFQADDNGDDTGDDDGDNGTNGECDCNPTCPAGFIDMGNFCVEPETRPEETWLEAADTCTDAGYSMCRMSELTSACRLNPAIQATMPPPSPPTPSGARFNGGEFVDSFHLNGPFTAHGVDSACLATIAAVVPCQFIVDPPGTQYGEQPFRCCADKR